MADDFWAEFEVFTDEDAPEFRFENIGDVIVGTLRQRKVADTKYGRKLLLILDTDDGLRTLWAGQAQLTRKLGELKPNVGDKLGIRFTGEDDSGKGNPMKVFNVKMERSARTSESPPPEEEFSDEPF